MHEGAFLACKTRWAKFWACPRGSVATPRRAGRWMNGPTAFSSSGTSHSHNFVCAKELVATFGCIYNSKLGQFLLVHFMTQETEGSLYRLGDDYRTAPRNAAPAARNKLWFGGGAAVDQACPPPPFPHRLQCCAVTLLLVSPGSNGSRYGCSNPGGQGEVQWRPWKGSLWGAGLLEYRIQWAGCSDPHGPVNEVPPPSFSSAPSCSTPKLVSSSQYCCYFICCQLHAWRMRWSHHCLDTAGDRPPCAGIAIEGLQRCTPWTKQLWRLPRQCM